MTGDQGRVVEAPGLPARTFARAGDVRGSRRADERFFERWKQADAGLPLPIEAREEYRALARQPE